MIGLAQHTLRERIWLVHRPATAAIYVIRFAASTTLETVFKNKNETYSPASLAYCCVITNAGPSTNTHVALVEAGLRRRKTHLMLHISGGIGQRRRTV